MHPDAWDEKKMAPVGTAVGDVRSCQSVGYEHAQRMRDEPYDCCEPPLSPKEWQKRCEERRAGYEAQEATERLEKTHTVNAGDVLR